MSSSSGSYPSCPSHVISRARRTEYIELTIFMETLHGKIGKFGLDLGPAGEFVAQLLFGAK